MMASTIFIFHICAGSVGLLSGAAALFLRKGSQPHRLAGNIFFVSMLCMSLSGIYLAFMKSSMIAVIAGSFTFYLVATSWMTIKRKEKEVGVFEWGALLFALVIGGAGLIFGWEASNSETGKKDGFPAGAYYFYGALPILSAFMDLRMILHGGVSGGQRIARHLWRMCFALYIAASSLFRGQQKIFPEVVREMEILSLPVLQLPMIVVMVSMGYWLVRVLFARNHKSGSGKPGGLPMKILPDRQ